MGELVETEEDLQELLPHVKFELPEPMTIFFGVGIQVNVSWRQDGNITFTAAGADFEVQDS